MKLVFYYDYKEGINGIVSLYINIFEELLLEKRGFIFFGHKGGIIDTELLKRGVELPTIDVNTFDWDTLDLYVSPSDVVVLTNFDHVYYKFLTVNPFVLYYNVNEFISKISYYKWGLKFKSLGRKLIERLEKKDALLFMDDVGIRIVTNYFNYNISKPKYLPIPIKVAQGNLFKEQYKTSNVLKLCYVGRVENWKMYPLRKVFEDLQISNVSNLIIDFTVVVDYVEKIHGFIDFKKFENKNLTIRLVENVLPSELPEFLLQNAHIGFAMGTAALDFAKVGIPVILLDYSTNIFPNNYKYRWLFENSNFSLGRNIQTNQEYFSNKHNLVEILNNVHDIDFLINISDSCYDYAFKKHSIKKVVNNLYNFAQGSLFKLSNSKPYLPYFWKFHQLVRKYI